MKISVLQMNSSQDLASNVAQVEAAFEDVAAKGSRLFLLPENALYFRVAGEAKTFALTGDEGFWGDWQKWSAKQGCDIVVGASPYLVNGRVMNATLWVNEKGLTNPYSKIHLFDVDVEGHKPVRESDQFCHGERPHIVELDGWKIGLSICYDIRFPELYLHYARQMVDLVLVPAAFLVPTGKAHWHCLLRTRAIESQCYVVAPAQAGEHREGERTRYTFGHSLAVDPWGESLAEGGEKGVELLHMTLAKSRIEEVRRQIPMAKHRRLT